MRGTTGTEQGLIEVAGFTILETELGAGREVPMHTHENATIILVLDGDYKESYRGQWLPHAPLTVIAKPAGERHANLIGDRSAHCLVVELSEAHVRAVGQAGSLWDGPLIEVRTPAATTALKILRELRSPDSLSALALECASLQLVIDISRKSVPVYRNEPRWMSTVIDMIHAGLPGEPRLSDLAQSVGIHPVHLARTFKRTMSCTVGAYVRQQRVDRALALLAESSLSLTEVALAAGFYDQSHMGKAIRNQTGMTAKRLRAVVRG